MVRAFPSVVIDNVQPLIDCGRSPIKRIVGEDLVVEADIFKDGHDVVAAVLKWRVVGKRAWRETPMIFVDNDRWRGVCTLYDQAIHEYTVEAWTDTFRSWQQEFAKKFEGGISDLRSEALEGAAIVKGAVRRARDRADSARLREFAEQSVTGANSEIYAIGQSGELDVLMATYPDRADATQYEPIPHVVVDRPVALFGAWYEFFPRSAEGHGDRGSTFRDVIARLPYVREMGFDVLYFPPIHPIGHTNRKGRNNSLVAQPDDPGSPYAIGSEAGGHTAIHPDLGTLQDFHRLVRAAHRHGLEIALDFAIQCSPDHPWIKEHPEWFDWRPDGTIKFAENPPKKYEDIVNLHLYREAFPAVWHALRDVILFWIEQGVKIFRVDNPHTKPLPFWEWLIHEVQARHPDAIFLAEAFTRPKLMKGLAKLGFTQSYTYFTWRTQKWELEQYLNELTAYPERDFYRPNFFVNTPDILPYHLQSGETWMFKSRVALAATLSSTYGVYNGFELLEHDPIPGKEEYLDSEKYEIKVRDWNRPGNIKLYIGDLNRARRANTALQQTSNLRFLGVADGNVIGFVKESVDRTNTVAVAIALSREPHEFWFPVGDIQIDAGGERKHVAAVEDLITGERRPVEWGGIHLRIDPMRDPALLFRCLA